MKLSSVTLVSFVLLASACTPEKSSTSHTQAEIDEASNLITQYGLQEMPSYDELLKYKNVETKDADGKSKLPWTDTYWATTNKNLAARWSFVNSEEEENQDPAGDFKLGAYFQTQLDSLKTSEDTLSINLSPAEKFDIAYRSIKGLTLDENSASLKALLTLDTRHEDFLKAEITQGDRVSSKRNLARAYDHALDAEQSMSHLSPLAAEGFQNWIQNSLDEGNVFPGETMDEAMDWSWEGICHGWAPAAVMSDEPKHAVKVKVKTSADSSKELLFTEGDIRALLDKSWADADNAEQFFIGRRCEANLSDPGKGVPSNAEGRGVSGSMSYTNEAGEETSGQFTVVQEYPRKSGTTALYRVILENEWKEGKPKFAYLIDRQGSRRTAGFTGLFFDETAAFAAVEAKTRSQAMKNASNVEYFGCWDVNPASFHAVLVENLGKKNLGFVMDRTQSGQVWNQPIGKADFEIGELKALADITDKAKDYRAPGTAFVAQVTATVSWSSEPSLPLFTYTGEDGSDYDASMIQETVYEYTLEFDANKKLIGGEWGTFDSFQAQENPDFLFGYTTKVEPNLDSAKDFLRDGYQAIIKKIHACSLKDDVKGTFKVEQDMWGTVETRTISFVDCDI